jgi:hypothetical protein
MAKVLTFTFNNDTKALRIFDAFCENHKYEDNKLKNENPEFDDELPESETNPLYVNIETKKDFIQRLTMKWWKRSAIKGEVDKGLATSQQTITDEIESIVITTGAQQ